MAKKKSYVPSRNPEKSTWAGNLKTVIATLGAGLGLSSGEITETQNACDDIVTGVNGNEAAKTVYQGAVAGNTTLINDAVTVIRSHIKRAKTHSGYTTAKGEQLGVIGDEISIDPATSQPELVGKKDPGGFRLEFNLHDFFEGVHIYKARNGVDFTFLALDTATPYIDADIAPGTSYYAFYILHDSEVGVKSNVVVV